MIKQGDLELPRIPIIVFVFEFFSFGKLVAIFYKLTPSRVSECGVDRNLFRMVTDLSCHGHCELGEPPSLLGTF